MQLHSTVVNGTGHVIRDSECSSDASMSGFEARLKHISNGLRQKVQEQLVDLPLQCFAETGQDGDGSVAIYV